MITSILLSLDQFYILIGLARNDDENIHIAIETELT